MPVVMCELTGRGRILQTKGSRLNIKYSQKNEYFIEDPPLTMNRYNIPKGTKNRGLA